VSKVLSKFSVLITFLIFVSCGVKKNSSLNYEAEQGYFKASIMAGICGGDKAKSLVTSSREIIELVKNQSTLQGHQYINQVNSLVLERGNFLTPIILGNSEIENKVSELKSLYEIENQRSFVGTNWLTLLDKSNDLDMSITRWAFHQCHLTNLVDSNSQELSDYLEIESRFCKEGCIESDFRKEKLKDSELRKKFVSMCSLVERKNSCAVTFDIATINKKQVEYIQEKLISVKKYFNNELYGLKNPAFNFECKKERGYYELSIPTANTTGKYELIGAIKKYWENEKLKVKFIDNEAGVRLHYSNTDVSRVESLKPNIIVLNKKLSGEFRVKTIAHEFGHVLGLRDCYLEYYDTTREEIIYYELERSKGNLMCSLNYGTNIPKKYSETLIQSFCH